SLANFVRKSASSMALSPPPTTAMSFSRKKNPSHVAHVDTPWPSRRASDGRPSIRADAPVEMIRASERYSVLPSHAAHGDADQSEQTDGDDREGGEDEEGREQPEHDGPGHVLSGGDRLVADGRDDPLDVVDRVGRPVAHGSSPRPRTRRAYPRVAGATQVR